MTHGPVIFLLLFFALENILVSLAKFISGELHCPSTAFIVRIKKDFQRMIKQDSFISKYTLIIRLFIFYCSEFIAGLFPENIEKLTRGRPTTASSKIKVR